MRLPRRIVTAVALALALPAAGCGSDEGGSGSGGEAPSARAIAGTGYTVQAPSGWRDGTAEASKNTSIKPDRLLVGPRLDGFTTNANVVFEPAPDADIAAVGDAFSKQITAIGATQISAVSRRELAGDPAVTYTYVLDQAGKQRRARQVAAIHGNRLYTVSLTAADVNFADAEKRFAEILSSWKWR